MAKLVITCQAQDDKGVIQSVGYREDTVVNGNAQSTPVKNVPKATMISMIRTNGYESRKTSKGSDIIIVKGTSGEYLRSDGDNNKTNDLLDCPKCT